MKLLYGEKVTPFPQGSVAAIGNFDGVHRGHQALLKKLRAKAEVMQLPMVVMLFEPQPGEYFRGQEAPPRLASLREKLQILKQTKVDYVYCLKFNAHLAKMAPNEFAEQYIFSLLKVKYLLIGEDFRFGHNRLGDSRLLQALGKESACTVEIFSNFSLGNARVSSTKIREALFHGQLEQAATWLGRQYSLCGRVIKGDGRGRQWGIPTANLKLQRQALPLKGVFCVQVARSSGELLRGVANLGSRPTVDGTKNILEIHLFDFNKDLYGEILQVFFLHKLRDEVKFSSVEALIAQIHVDIAAAKAQFEA